MNITADGVLMPYGKVFNQQYPGPWIRMSYSFICALLKLADFGPTEAC